MTDTRLQSGTRGRVAWCLYDWANSAFPTVITTFVFAAYFTKGVAVDEISGTSQWGYAMSLSALAVAVAGPILGSVADHGGRRKLWLAGFTLIAAAGAAMLWTILPDAAYIVHALFWVALANFAFEMGMVFYNAMLADLAPANRLGRWSGWGWGLGYAGGLICLGLVLVGFVQADTPWFGLQRSLSEELRVTGPFVGIWMIIFALPLFVFTPDKPSTGKSFGAALTDGMATLWRTFKELKNYAVAARFLVARMIYTDGLNTLFAFGGIYAAGTFGMSFEELIIFGIAMNLTAGLGAFGFAWIDDKIGSKQTILIAVAGLAVLGTTLLVVEGKTMFWVFGLPLGLFVGPAQAASRTMMAHLAPAEMRTEFFGLFALSGKATAFMGPALLAWATVAFNSQRAGMATIIVFFAVGMALMFTVPALKR
ncbi:MAG: MFS transporter [Rhodospirillaceae bacterium]|nr:MFS transporter [Rhodospirillaceae bacterium]